MATGKRPRVVLCAEITADGKLADSASTVPPALYDGSADPARHPWARLYDQAKGILVDGDLAATLPMPLAAARTIIALHLRRAGPESPWQQELTLGLKKLGLEQSGGYVLCFGGAELFRALLKARLADELRLIVRPQIDGRRETPSLGGPGMAEFFPSSVVCRLLDMEACGDQCLLHYRVLKRRSKPAANG